MVHYYLFCESERLPSQGVDIIHLLLGLDHTPSAHTFTDISHRWRQKRPHIQTCRHTHVHTHIYVDTSRNTEIDLHTKYKDQTYRNSKMPVQWHTYPHTHTHVYTIKYICIDKTLPHNTCTTTCLQRGTLTFVHTCTHSKTDTKR